VFIKRLNSPYLITKKNKNSSGHLYDEQIICCDNNSSFFAVRTLCFACECLYILILVASLLPKLAVPSLLKVSHAEELNTLNLDYKIDMLVSGRYQVEVLFLSCLDDVNLNLTSEIKKVYVRTPLRKRASFFGWMLANMKEKPPHVQTRYQGDLCNVHFNGHFNGCNPKAEWFQRYCFLNGD